MCFCIEGKCDKYKHFVELLTKFGLGDSIEGDRVMLSKKANGTIRIVIIVIILIISGYIFRFDRFGISKISWVDCVQINNIKYYSDFNRSPVEYSLIGNKIGEVKFNVSKNVNNANYRFRNGDATFLEVGTEIYRLKSDNSAIAVKIGELYYLFKPM